MPWGRGHDRRPAEPPAPAPGDGWLVVGAPAAGTGETVRAMDQAGIAAVRDVDPAFDPGAFLTWAGSVFGRAVAAWRDKSPEPLRPVMAREVWDRYAQFLHTGSRVALIPKLMASAQATATLSGAAATPAGESVLVTFYAVPVAPEAQVLAHAADGWHERWLFQRPPGFRTHASGRVAVCPVCGAPADPADSGECRYCHANITTRTAGWLVTQTATSMKSAARLMPSPAVPPTGTPLQPPRAPRS